MIRTIILLVASLTFIPMASQDSYASKVENATEDQRLSSIVQLSEGLIVGEGISASGEKIYFGMERITPANKPGLDAFQDMTNAFLNKDSGRISILAELHAEGKAPQFEAIPQNIRDLFGFTAEEYNTFLSTLFENKSREEALSFADKFKNIPGGINYMHTDLGNYIVYMSKTPIVKPLSWDLKWEPGSRSTFKDYLTSNPNLVMIFGSWVEARDGSNYLQNRGVSKTLQSLLAGGHSNVSMNLQAFSGAAASKYLGQDYLKIGANPYMSKILRKELKEGDYTEYSAGVGDQGFIIKLNALIDMYANANKK